MLKRYLETIPVLVNDVASSHIMNLPPEQFPIGGNQSITQNVNNTLWELYEKDLQFYILLNTSLLKDHLKRGGIVIKEGEINYDVYNNIIAFEVMDINERLSIEQFEYIRTLLTFPEYVEVELVPETAKVILHICNKIQIGGTNAS